LCYEKATHPKETTCNAKKCLGSKVLMWCDLLARSHTHHEKPFLKVKPHINTLGCVESSFMKVVCFYKWWYVDIFPPTNVQEICLLPSPNNVK
jgi:hypothetical protein